MTRCDKKYIPTKVLKSLNQNLNKEVYKECGYLFIFTLLSVLLNELILIWKKNLKPVLIFELWAKNFSVATTRKKNILMVFQSK